MEKQTIKGKVLTNQFTKHGTVSGIVLPDPRFPMLQLDDMEPSFYVSGALPVGSDYEVTGKVR